MAPAQPKRAPSEFTLVAIAESQARVRDAINSISQTVVDSRQALESYRATIERADAVLTRRLF
jgi:hypothetical protein